MQTAWPPTVTLTLCRYDPLRRGVAMLPQQRSTQNDATNDLTQHLVVERYTHHSRQWVSQNSATLLSFSCINALPQLDALRSPPTLDSVHMPHCNGSTNVAHSIWLTLLPRRICYVVHDCAVIRLCCVGFYFNLQSSLQRLVSDQSARLVELTHMT